MLEKNNFIRFTRIETDYIGIIKYVTDLYIYFQVLVNSSSHEVYDNVSMVIDEIINVSELNENERELFIHYLAVAHRRIWFNNDIIRHEFGIGQILAYGDTSYVMRFDIQYPYYYDAVDVLTGKSVNINIDVRKLRKPTDAELIAYLNPVPNIRNANLKDIGDILVDNFRPQPIKAHNLYFELEEMYDFAKDVVKKVYKLGDIIHVRNSETEEWVTKFFACEDKTSSGEVVIKTTDGRLWKLYK